MEEKRSFLTKEMIHYVKDGKKRKNFSGEDSLSPEERLEFLRRYAFLAAKWYGDETLSQQAVCEEEIERFLEEQNGSRASTQLRKTIRFETMEAFAVRKVPEYRGVHLYCGARAEKGELVFPERSLRPTPCARIELSEPKEALAVRMEIFLPESYRAIPTERCGDAQGGRVIELRCGTLDKVKIKLCNTGEAILMQGDMWNPTNAPLGRVRFGEYNRLEIRVGETVSAALNGESADGLPCTAEGKVDSIFFDGGMFPRDAWSVRALAVDGRELAFERNTEPAPEPEALGEVRLPYCLGGVKNRDKRLYLTKKFTVGAAENAYLELSTLDPGGCVWLNGQKVAECGDFMRRCVRVTELLREGENELTVMVEPRAPEVYYFWHRHTDCYNGWFCGEIALHLVRENFIRRAEVRTEALSPCVRAEARVELDRAAAGSVKLFARQCWPRLGEERLLAERPFSGKEAVVPFGGELAAWDTECPVLYAVRAVLCDETGAELDDFVVETGFRTIEQKNGGIVLNGRQVMLCGALIMQFLAPYEEVPVNHMCPTDEQIAWQMLALKKMNGNFMRLHILGYGTNDARFARIADRLGIMLAWITRCIDSLEEMAWEGGWKEEEAYCSQIRDVINHPSIILYEGSNEYHPRELETVDRMYRAFTGGVKRVDPTRLLSPCSHLYYGGGLYDLGCRYYNEDGSLDQDGAPACADPAWTDGSVVRSAHTYSLLCGYGHTWSEMRAQAWKWQDELLRSKKHSYLITEFAVTALACPDTPEARRAPYIESYERPNEIGAIGRLFAREEWRESQALQALCAFGAVKQMRLLGVDGMAWCCLSGGANDGSYLKPVIDFYGYKKLGYYALRDAYREHFACCGSLDVEYARGDAITPVVFGGGEDCSLKITVTDEDGRTVDEKEYRNVKPTGGRTVLEPFAVRWAEEGYYTIQFELDVSPRKAERGDFPLCETETML